MRLPHVVVRVGEGPARMLYPGALIGRSPTADLFIADPEVSEAHAWVSARGDALWLLALRGRVRDEDTNEHRNPRLTQGRTIWLSKNRVLLVEAVYLPDERLALSRDGGPPVVLNWTHVGLRFGDDPWVVDADRGASTRVWAASGRHYLEMPVGAEPVELIPGTVFDAEGHNLEVLTVRSGGVSWTEDRALASSARVEVVSLHPPQVLVCEPEGREAIVRGQAAMLLVALGRAAGYRMSRGRAAIAAIGRGAAESNLERNVLHRLRVTLRAARLRDDLVVNAEGFVSLQDGVVFVDVREPGPGFENAREGA